MATSTQPVYVQIAEKLQERARVGDSTPPPSVRKLAAQFGVSSVTASRALQFFRLRLVGEAGVPSPDNAPAQTERWAVCLHVSPGPHQHAAAELTADGFRALARDRRIKFDFDALRCDGSATAEHMRARVVAAVDRGARGIFLLPSRISDDAMRADEAVLDAAEKAGVPVVMIERNLRGEDRPITHDLVCFHDFEGGRLLTRHLLAQGRKRIAFLTGSPTSSHVERLAGYLSALHSAGIGDSLVTSHSAGVAPGVSYTELASQLIDWQADGVICFHEYAALGIIMELLRRGRSIPQNFGVAAFYSLGLSESFSIGVTTYAYPAETVAARALDIMRWRINSPTAPPLKVVVPGELVVRSSTVATSVR